VAYGLFQDSGRTTNWGDNPPPATTVDTVGGTGAGSAQSLPVYGRIPPQTTPTQGAYSDTVVVTVYY
jgi:spore coat protein U-like protein